MLARFGGYALIAAVLLLVSACGSAGSADRWSAPAIGASQSELHPGLVNSQVGVGQNRLAFAIYGKDGALIHNATARVRLYRLNGDRGEAAGKVDLHASTLREDLAHKHPDGSTHAYTDPLITVYAGEADLNRAEWWGAELDVTRGGTRYDPVRLRFFVQPQTAEPAIGGPAPRTQQLVLRDVDDVARVDSSVPPRPTLHQQTVAEAIDAGRPAVIAFAIAKYGLGDVPMARDEQGRVYLNYGVEVVSESFFLQPGRRVRTHFVNGWTEATLREHLDALTPPVAVVPVRKRDA